MKNFHELKVHSFQFKADITRSWKLIWTQSTLFPFQSPHYSQLHTFMYTKYTLSNLSRVMSVWNGKNVLCVHESLQLLVMSAFNWKECTLFVRKFATPTKVGFNWKECTLCVWKFATATKVGFELERVYFLCKSARWCQFWIDKIVLSEAAKQCLLHRK